MTDLQEYRRKLVCDIYEQTYLYEFSTDTYSVIADQMLKEYKLITKQEHKEIIETIEEGENVSPCPIKWCLGDFRYSMILHGLESSDVYEIAQENTREMLSQVYQGYCLVEYDGTSVVVVRSDTGEFGFSSLLILMMAIKEFENFGFDYEENFQEFVDVLSEWEDISERSLNIIKDIYEEKK